MRPKYFIYAFIVLLLGIPLWLYLSWTLKKRTPMAIVVVDKTVASYPAKEHLGIFWALKNKKITKENGEFYDPAQDYFGFFPAENQQFKIQGLEQLSNDELLVLAKKTELLYFADGYGIFDYDLHNTRPSVNAKKIYGGLSREDIFLLTEMKRLNKKVIAEFNCMNSPSSRAFRLDFQKIFSVRWSGWIGKFYVDLSKENIEIPQYLLDNYMHKNGKPWPFEGAGILLMHENGKYLVLRNGIELENPIPKIITSSTFRKKYHLPREIEYPSWFEINQISRKNEVISIFQLPTNSIGDSLLQAFGLSKFFPAAIANTSEGQSIYYFCADFADNPVDYELAILDKLAWLKIASANGQNQSMRELFFYKYYLPLFTTILETPPPIASR